MSVFQQPAVYTQPLYVPLYSPALANGQPQTYIPPTNGVQQIGMTAPQPIMPQPVNSSHVSVGKFAKLGAMYGFGSSFIANGIALGISEKIRNDFSKAEGGILGKYAYNVLRHTMICTFVGSIVAWLYNKTGPKNKRPEG